MNEEKEITKILMELGTPCHLAGYDLIRQAVVIMLNNEKIKQTDIYRQLAENVGKTQSQVERNIRHAIEVTFYNIRPEMAKNTLATVLVTTKLSRATRSSSLQSRNTRRTKSYTQNRGIENDY